MQVVGLNTFLDIVVVNFQRKNNNDCFGFFGF